MPTVNETRGKLVGFAYLPEGWHFKQGIPAKEIALTTAVRILNDLEKAGFNRTDAYPAIDGGVMVSAYDLPNSYDFDIKPSGLITVAHERGDEDVFYQEQMAVVEVLGKIKEFGVSKCHTLDFLISGITTAGNTDASKVMHSRTRKMDRVSLSSRATAPEVSPKVFVNTVPDFTQQSPARRFSFGKSPKRSFEVAGI